MGLQNGIQKRASRVGFGILERPTKNPALLGQWREEA